MSMSLKRVDLQVVTSYGSFVPCPAASRLSCSTPILRTNRTASCLNARFRGIHNYSHIGSFIIIHCTRSWQMASENSTLDLCQLLRMIFWQFSFLTINYKTPPCPLRISPNKLNNKPPCLITKISIYLIFSINWNKMPACLIAKHRLLWHRSNVFRT